MRDPESLANPRLGLALATMLFVSGLANTFPIFFPPLLAEFGGSRAATASTVTLFWLGGATLGPLAGHLVDRWNPRLLVTLGLGAAALGFGVGAGGGVGAGLTGMVAQAALIADAYVRRRGLATGIAFSGSMAAYALATPAQWGGGGGGGGAGGGGRVPAPARGADLPRAPRRAAGGAARGGSRRWPGRAPDRGRGTVLAPERRLHGPAARRLSRDRPARALLRLARLLGAGGGGDAGGRRRALDERPRAGRPRRRPLRRAGRGARLVRVLARRHALPRRARVRARPRARVRLRALRLPAARLTRDDRVRARGAGRAAGALRHGVRPARCRQQPRRRRGAAALGRALRPDGELPRDLPRRRRAAGARDRRARGVHAAHAPVEPVVARPRGRRVEINLKCRLIFLTCASSRACWETRCGGRLATSRR